MPFPPAHPALERALAAQGYAEPTPVQAAVLEPEAAGCDLLVSAQTGSGKTVAYGLAFADTLLGEKEKFGWAAGPVALIIAPTRELALQVSRELTWLYAETGARIATCVGGMDARREQRALAAGVHIVVGTPGRLRDHADRGNLDLSALKVVVLDEADEMLDMGFREDLEAILDVTPAERRTLLFSATIARDIAELAKQYQSNALRIDTVSKREPHGDIEYRAIRVAPNEVEHAVVNVLRFFEAPRALVFCSKRETVRHLNAALRERGFATVALSGELAQNARNDALQALRDGQARVCVATDVAARGLDLPDLGLVIHADLPVNTATLLHRSGRTGRAGKKGVSVILAPYSRRRKVEQMLAAAHVDAAWSGPPTPAEIREGDQRRLLQDAIFADAADAEDDLPLARALMEGRSAEDIALALVRLHRARLPEPEEVFDAGPWKERGSSRALPTDRMPRDYEEDSNPRPGRSYEPMEGGAWFRLNIGRRANADPKWLIPAICRVGHVTKKDIGQIRIFETETKFEIAGDAKDRFMAAVEAHPDEQMKVQPAEAPGPRAAGRPRREGESDKRPHEKKAYEKKAYEKKPYEKKAYATREEGGVGRPERADRAAWADRSEPAEKAPWQPRPPRGDDERAAKPFKKKPFVKDGAERGGEKPFAQKPFAQKPFAQKPFTKKPYAGKAGDKPFTGPPRGGPKGGKPFTGKKAGKAAHKRP